jgi:DNA polymerase III alpha subunit
MDAWALTDHGNGNGHAHARAAALKLQKKGVKYRQLYGVEFYFVPSLSQWRSDYEAHKQSIKDAKSSAEAERRLKVPTDIDADVVETEDEEGAGGHVVEDEAETKADDYKEKPEWQRRYHLVAVAKNRTGLANIYRLVKASFKDGFYRYPRIDFDLIRRYGEGIIWSTACLTGDAELVTEKGTETLLDVIERYRAGENPMVLSFNEESKELQFKRVLWGDKTRTAAKIVKLKTADGKEVRLTPDHQVLTDKGWLRADDLKENMPVKIVSL